MPALDTLSWDLAAGDGGPRRPSLDDVGGATLVDDAEHPPDPTTMPYADQLNQLQLQAAAVGQIVPFLGFSVHVAGGVPGVVAVASPRTGVALTDLTPTDNGVGDTTITWPANTFPPATLKPVLTINQDIGGIVGGTAVAVTNGVRVRTYNASGAADLDFTLSYI